MDPAWITDAQQLFVNGTSIQPRSPPHGPSSTRSTTDPRTQRPVTPSREGELSIGTSRNEVVILLVILGSATERETSLTTSVNFSRARQR